MNDFKNDPQAYGDAAATYVRAVKFSMSGELRSKARAFIDGAGCTREEWIAAYDAVAAEPKCSECGKRK